MAIVRPFRALRPPADLAAQVAALPYDVMNVAEAREMADGNAASFLHISRPEIDLPEGIDPYDDAVYARGRMNLQSFIATGMLVPDEVPTMSVYRQRTGRHIQTGIVALASVDDYESGVIAKHELTRADKELDRVRHIDALAAQDEPVFLLSPRSEVVEAVIAEVTFSEPDLQVVTDDGIGHTLWVISNPAQVTRVTEAFAGIPRLYVADGHHRSAAASRVRALRRQRDLSHGYWPEHDGFLAVIFAADELEILAYNRVVLDLADRSAEDLLVGLAESFTVTAIDGPPTPSVRHGIGMYLAGQWYR
ncbi:MAG: DUF1015 domain-containing protein, partial [Actinomycetes bacterium]